jgi:hypothetical protein
LSEVFGIIGVHISSSFEKSPMGSRPIRSRLLAASPDSLPDPENLDSKVQVWFIGHPSIDLSVEPVLACRFYKMQSTD